MNHVNRGTDVRSASCATTSPQSRIKPPFSGHRFEPALAGIQRLVVQIRTIENDDLAGIQLVLVGDFLQLPPVANDGVAK